MPLAQTPPTISPAWSKIDSRSRDSFKHIAQHGIREASLDEFESLLRAADTLTRPSLIVRCKITEQRPHVWVVVDKPVSRWRLTQIFLPFLNRVLPRVLGNAEFFVLISDNVYVSKSARAHFVESLKRVPFLRCDQMDGDEISSHAILIPDFNIQEAKYAEELSSVERAASEMPFERRSEIIKWRGTLSGPEQPTIDNLARFPRYTLLAMSRRYPNILDARLTTDYNLYGDEPVTALRLHLERMLGGPTTELPIDRFVAHKYLVSLDGAVAAWKRVPTILASGSVLLLQHRWKQFFYPALESWVHYVPLRDDLSNLVERHGWMVNHPAEAKTIAEKGQQFAREILQPVALETFFVNVVNECCRLYTR